jgi:hypothetical protein
MNGYADHHQPGEDDLATLGNRPAAASSPAQLGWQAAEAIRTLNHRTHPPTLADPAEVCQLLAGLATIAYGLPQLLSQLSRWLQTEQATDRLRADTPAADPAEITASTAHELTRAGLTANRLGDALDSAHQHLAHLAVNEDDS